jgi:hypothetical protein
MELKDAHVAQLTARLATKLGAKSTAGASALGRRGEGEMKGVSQ